MKKMKIKKYTKKEAEEFLGYTKNFLSRTGENPKRPECIYLGAACMHFGISFPHLEAYAEVIGKKITKKKMVEVSGLRAFNSLSTRRCTELMENTIKRKYCLRLGAMAKVLDLDTRKINALAEIVKSSLVFEMLPEYQDD